jgi:hypothetical protein
MELIARERYPAPARQGFIGGIMKGHPTILYLQDGSKFDTARQAALYFGLTPGRLSQKIEEATDEGKPYTIIKEQRLYIGRPAKPKIKAITFRPENVLLHGHVTMRMGVWR